MKNAYRIPEGSYEGKRPPEGPKSDENNIKMYLNEICVQIWFRIESSNGLFRTVPLNISTS